MGGKELKVVNSCLRFGCFIVCNIGDILIAQPTVVLNTSSTALFNGSQRSFVLPSH